MINFERVLILCPHFFEDLVKTHDDNLDSASLEQASVQFIIQTSNFFKEDNIDVVFFHLEDNPYNFEKMRERLTEFIKNQKISSIIGSLGGRESARFCRDLFRVDFFKSHNINLLDLCPRSLKLSKDYYYRRELLSRCGFSMTPSLFISNEMQDLKSDLVFPLDIKPLCDMRDHKIMEKSQRVHKVENFMKIIKENLSNSSLGECLVQSSIDSYKRVSIEVIRDADNHLIVALDREKLDDCLEVIPFVSLSQKDFEALELIALDVVRAFGFKGIFSVDFAIDEKNSKYYVHDVEILNGQTKCFSFWSGLFAFERAFVDICLKKKISKRADFYAQLEFNEFYLKNINYSKSLSRGVNFRDSLEKIQDSEAKSFKFESQNFLFQKKSNYEDNKRV